MWRLPRAVIAKWDNGVQRVFKNKDKLNVIITKAELDMWCEENHFTKPTYEVIEDEEVKE